MKQYCLSAVGKLDPLRWSSQAAVAYQLLIWEKILPMAISLFHIEENKDVSKPLHIEDIATYIKESNH
jgi:hypothetical protein